MNIKINEQLFSEFFLIFLTGIYSCYENKSMDYKRMQHWLLNGKTSSFLRKKNIIEIENLFETFEEIMRFESLEDNDIIDFERAFKEIKALLLSETMKAQKENKENYFLQFQEND